MIEIHNFVLKKIKDFIIFTKQKSNRKSITFVIANLVNFIFGSSFWFVAARFYSINFIGYAGNAITAAIFLGSFSLFGINLVILRKYANNIEKLKQDLLILLLIVTFLGLLFSGIYFLFLYLFNEMLYSYFTTNLITITSFLIIVISWGGKFIQESVLIIIKKPKLVLIRNIIDGFLRFSSILLLSFISKKSYDLIVSWALSIFLSASIISIKFIPKLKIKYTSFANIKSMFKISFFYFIAYQLLGSPAFILSTFIINRYGAEVNGIFYISWTVVSIILSVPRSVSLYSMPEYINSILQVNILKKAIKISFLLEFFIIVIFVFFGKYIFLVFGKTYSEQSTILFLILIIAVFPFTLIKNYYELIRTNDEYKKMIITSCLLVFILVNTLLLDLRINSIFYVCGSYSFAMLITSVYVLFDLRHRLQKY
ncbi:MAG: lipopolysaccharide biosynthesis protein [Candidatus Helarchaeota archaeon]